MRQMHASTVLLYAPSSSARLDCRALIVAVLTSPQAPGDAKVQSHPVRFGSRASGGNLSPALSSAVSGADSTVWDDPDEAQQPALTSQRSNSGGPSSPWEGGDRPGASRGGAGPTASDSTTQRPSAVRSRLAAASSAVADPSGEDAMPGTPIAQRRLTWLGILLEALLLFGIIAAFLVVEMLKARREICTWQFGMLYGIQVGPWFSAVRLSTYVMTWMASSRDGTPAD